MTWHHIQLEKKGKKSLHVIFLDLEIRSRTSFHFKCLFMHYTVVLMLPVGYLSLRIGGLPWPCSSCE